MSVNLYAKYMHTDCGTNFDKRICTLCLSCGGLYKVEKVDMGQCATDIYLANYKPIFNSVMFDFYELTDDNELKPYDIYSSAEFNPYIRKDRKRLLKGDK